MHFLPSVPSHGLSKRATLEGGKMWNIVGKRVERFFLKRNDE